MGFCACSEDVSGARRSVSPKVGARAKSERRGMGEGGRGGEKKEIVLFFLSPLLSRFAIAPTSR